jgi:hypothetical protein
MADDVLEDDDRIVDDEPTARVSAMRQLSKL